jgi:nitrogen fixation protein FixH
MTAAEQSEEPMGERVITGRHVLFGLIVFFGIIFTANGAFLYLALSTYTGIVSNEPYRKGLNYNERIAADKAQHKMGWSSAITLAKGGDSIDVVLRNRSGNPITGLGFDGRLGRPATEALDVALPLKEIEPGRYRGTFATLAPGAWQIDLVAKQLTSEGEKIVWRDRKRIRWMP